ncbi:MAG TPA: CNNM domain-containing protein [Phycisphaerales bacterium]|nr:CNNM domain-containing protein [Phycisphaerales bacterium]
MTPLEWTVWWTILVLAVLGSALIAGIEIGVYSLNRVRLDLRAGRTPPDRDARVLAGELGRPARLVATLLISNNLVNALAAQASASMIGAGALTPTQIAVLNTVVLGPILFVLGEALPKEVFRAEADRLTPIFASGLRLLRRLLTVTGVLPLVTLVSRLGERALGLPEDAGVAPRQRIAMLLKEGAGHGLLSESQLSMLDRALVFSSVRVADEMVSWERVQVVPAGAERSRMLDIVAGSAHAYFPAVDRQGRVVGVIRHLDLYAQSRRTPQDIVMNVPRVRPDQPARDALAVLRAAKSRLAVVEDASGRPVGLVTAKDLVEPITGELASL